MARSATETVQARDIDTVIYMYQLYGVPCFAIWIKDMMFFPYTADTVQDGAAVLEQIIEKLEESGTAAVYTLKVYESVPPEGLTNKTGYKAAFNFQLRQIRDEQGGYIGNVKAPATDPAVMSLLQAMQLQMAEMQKRMDERDNEEPESDLIGQIAGFAETPVGQQVVGKILGMLFGGNNNNQLTAPVYTQEPKRATMSGINTMDEQQQKALQAFEILKTIDPAIGDNLLILAGIAQRDPQQFLGFLSMLKTMA